MGSKQKRLGEILIEKCLLTQEQLTDALDEQKRTGEFLGEILLKRTSIRESDLLKSLSEQFNITFIDLRNKDINRELVKEFSSSLILDHKCFPLEKSGRTLTMAIINPLDVEALKKAEDESKGVDLKIVLVSKEDMQEFIKKYQQYMKEDISKFFE